MRTIVLVTLAALVAAAGVNAAATARKTVTISARKVPGLGRVLVDAKGRTLYMFVPDKQKKVTCVKTAPPPGRP